MNFQALSEGDLRRGFDAFIEASRRLEESYSALKARAMGFASWSSPASRAAC